VARGLVTGRSHTIGLIVSDIRNPFFAEVARGAEDAARASQCDVVLCNSDLDPGKQMDCVDLLLQKQVDGILMNSVSALSKAQQDQLARSGVPIVLLNRGDQKAFSTVSVDNVAGGAMVAEYLLKLGHRKIGHITGPRHHGNMTERRRSFEKVMKAAGVDPVVIHGENSFAGGYDLTRKLLKEHPKITAIFAANDVMAFGGVRAILESGRQIPRDISLVGFDDVELASVVHPPLTTVHQPKQEIGRAAVEILLRLGRSHEKPIPEDRQLGVEFIERQSCRKLN
jgi:LacI family transcriptional regulator